MFNYGERLIFFSLKIKSEGENEEKNEEKMGRDRWATNNPPTLPREGRDLLFDIETRRLVKFVLHTNVPGHFDFGIYDRCEFILKAETKSMEELNIGTESKLESFRSLFDHQPNSNITSGNNDTFSGPVVLNKSSSEGENPFGSSFCYGTDQMIFEVLDNGHIASVVLFDPLLGP